MYFYCCLCISIVVCVFLLLFMYFYCCFSDLVPGLSKCPVLSVQVRYIRSGQVRSGPGKENGIHVRSGLSD